MGDIRYIVFFGAIILLTGLIYLAYRLNENLNRPLPPDARCRNCRTTIRDAWHDIRCTHRKSNVYGCTVDDFSRCRLWRGRKPDKG